METKVTNITEEMLVWNRYPESVIKRHQSWLDDLQAKSRKLPGGFIKKIVWDKEGGYPEHSWGFIQYTLRPYVQGYGCDGTTDNNIHLIAMHLSAMLGLQYEDLFLSAYPDEKSIEEVFRWFDIIRNDPVLRKETKLPKTITQDALLLALHDLYDINNRSLVCVICESWSNATGYNLHDWYLHVDRLKRSAA